MLRRRSAPEIFLGARPVPTRIAGYAPAPLEPGRVPDAPTLEVPLPEPAPVAQPVFPPKRAYFLPPGRFDPLPPVLIVPPPAPPGPPPCDEDDKDCEPPPPPPPPEEVSEPAVAYILLAGLLALFLGLRGLPVPAPIRRRR